MQFDGCSVIDSDLELFWSINDTSKEIETAFRTKLNAATGYVGFAYGYKEMVPSIAVIAYKTSKGKTAAMVYDMNAKSTPGVQPRKESGLFPKVDADSDTHLTGYFVRSLEASSDLPSISKGSTDYIWAKGSPPSDSNSLVEHSVKNSGTVNLADTKEGTVTQTESSGNTVETIFIVHGVLMAVGWALLAPLGILFARFLKGRGLLWFHMHRATMLIVFAIVLAAYIMGVVKGDHSEKVHLALGTVAVGGILFQAAGGLLRPKNESSLRSIWLFLHHWSGRLLVALAFANSIIGLDIIGASKGYIIAISVVFGILVIGGILLSIVKQFRKKTPYQKVQDPEQVTDQGEI